MKDIQDWAAVQRCYKINKSIRATAKQLGMSRNTVRKLLKLKDEPTYNRKIYPSKVDDYKELIITWRCEPYLFNGTRIYRELRNRGYTASIAPVYRFLKKIDEEIDILGINKKATTRIETPLDDQAQFDWSHYNMMINGKYRTVYCFAMILAASRKKAILFSLKADATAIYDAIQELFEELGGVTLELLIDNPKALVIENNPKSEYEIVYNPHALMLAKHLGTELNACPCYWPRKKGKIENSLNYIEEQFVKGNHFASMFSNGYRYLEAASKQFTQPTHYAKKIMELQDLYSIEILDTLIGIANILLIIAIIVVFNLNPSSGPNLSTTNSKTKAYASKSITVNNANDKATCEKIKKEIKELLSEEDNYEIMEELLLFGDYIFEIKEGGVNSSVNYFN